MWLMNSIGMFLIPANNLKKVMTQFYFNTVFCLEHNRHDRGQGKSVPGSPVGIVTGWTIGVRFSVGARFLSSP
jgi:hypothetical protein